MKPYLYVITNTVKFCFRLVFNMEMDKIQERVCPICRRCIFLLKFVSALGCGHLICDTRDTRNVVASAGSQSLELCLFTLDPSYYQINKWYSSASTCFSLSIFAPLLLIWSKGLACIVTESSISY